MNCYPMVCKCTEQMKYFFDAAHWVVETVLLLTNEKRGQKDIIPNIITKKGCW